MAPRPLVSIGLPTYNRANGYLRATLQSSLNQTYPDIEIIVSDNCSSDNTVDLVRSHADPRVRYHKQPKTIPMADNFNYCLAQARGAYFLLLPDDDLIDPDFVDTCMTAAKFATDIGIIRTGARVIDAEGRVTAEYPNRVGGLSTLEFFLGWFGGKTAPYCCSTLLNTGRFKEVGGFRSRHSLWMDTAALFKLAAPFGRVDIQDIKASFRKHGDEATFAVKVGAWCEDSLELLDLMGDMLPEHRQLLRTKGLPFLAYLCYNKAKAVQAPVGRLAAFFTVFRKFGFRSLPTKDQWRR